MGGCSSTPEEAEANVKSKEIDRAIQAEKRNTEESIKLLLLGSGESGKSTILKQFRLLHGLGFSDQERRAFRSAIISNIVSCGKTLVEAMGTLSIPYDTLCGILPRDQQRPSADFSVIRDAPNVFGDGESVPERLFVALNLLWKDSGVQKCVARANEFQLLDMTDYTDYVPLDQDILSARIMTTTITETKIEIESVLFKIYDVGGQRSERKKWAPYFDDVMAIIFVVAISSFDQTCFEDLKTNRMLESLNLFGSICNHPLFKKTAVILFLNKIDLLKKKLEHTKVQQYFEDYTGDNSFDDVAEFFAKKYLLLNKNKEKKIYVHLTWATDSNQIRAVIRAVNTIILK
ncbi:guanine nucleotide-binding protein subunit alpha [Phlyctochytrium planicorne]|nr:guanine nucleotide-binding protein subunit alpha [Phlyctochytrium planicorne]